MTNQDDSPLPSPYDLDATSREPIAVFQSKQLASEESPYVLHKESALAALHRNMNKSNPG